MNLILFVTTLVNNAELHWFSDNFLICFHINKHETLCIINIQKIPISTCVCIGVFLCVYTRKLFYNFTSNMHIKEYCCIYVVMNVVRRIYVYIHTLIHIASKNIC